MNHWKVSEADALALPLDDNSVDLAARRLADVGAKL